MGGDLRAVFGGTKSSLIEAEVFLAKDEDERNYGVLKPGLDADKRIIKCVTEQSKVPGAKASLASYSRDSNIENLPHSKPP